MNGQDFAQNPVVLEEDKLLKSLKRWWKGDTLLWLPGGGRSVAKEGGSYCSFTHIVRVLHLEDALQVCITKRMEAKSVVTFCSIDSRDLPPGHPCANLKVLWFSAKPADVKQESSNWYGNVEFAVDAQILLSRYKYHYLVEMMTAPTHTTSRILVTNSDYSLFLSPYDCTRDGGPWRVTANGQEALIDCSRYRFEGVNRHNHIIEFMIEANPEDECAILNSAQISLQNHEMAQFSYIPHVCNRYQRLRQPCPTPFSALKSAIIVFDTLQMYKDLLQKLPRTNECNEIRLCELFLKTLLQEGIETIQEPAVESDQKCTQCLF